VPTKLSTNDAAMLNVAAAVSADLDKSHVEAVLKILRREKTQVAPPAGTATLLIMVRLTFWLAVSGTA